MTPEDRLTGDELREELEELGLGQNAAAGLWGVNERTMGRWVSGEQDIPHWVPMLLLVVKQLAVAGWALQDVKREHRSPYAEGALAGIDRALRNVLGPNSLLHGRPRWPDHPNGGSEDS